MCLFLCIFFLLLLRWGFLKWMLVIFCMFLVCIWVIVLVFCFIILILLVIIVGNMVFVFVVVWVLNMVCRYLGVGVWLNCILFLLLICKLMKSGISKFWSILIFCCLSLGIESVVFFIFFICFLLVWIRWFNIIWLLLNICGVK